MKARGVLSKLTLLAMLAVLLAGCGGDNSAGNNSGNSTSGNSTGGNSTSSNSTSSGTSSTGSSSSGNTNSGSSGFNPSDLQVTATGSYSSNLGLYYYMGVVKNNGSATLQEIKVLMADSKGNDVLGNEVALLTAVLPPGKSAGFNFQAQQAVDKPSFTFSAKTVDTGGALPPLDLSVSNDKLDSASQMITGTVTNNSAKSSYVYSINAMGYDASGNLVSVVTGSATDPAAGGTIPAHGSLQFVADFSSLAVKGANVTKYVLFASGLQSPLTKIQPASLQPTTIAAPRSTWGGAAFVINLAQRRGKYSDKVGLPI